MRLSGYQPQYFPRLHFFNRALNSDVFEISDDIQFVKKHAYPAPDGTSKRGKSFQADTLIKLAPGPVFLTVPVHDKLLAINKTLIDNSTNWVHKHLKSIQTGYSRSENFSKFFPEIELILKKNYDNLASLNIQTFFWGIARLITNDAIDVESLSVKFINSLILANNPYRLRKLFIASQSPVKRQDYHDANDWILALCKYAAASEYFYGGTSHLAYMDVEKFRKAKIKLSVQDWTCRKYLQQYRKVGFIPNLSVIDLIMNLNLKERQKIIE